MMNFSFNSNEFNSIFPFYLLFSFDLKLISYGQSIKILIPELETEGHFSSFFEIDRPKVDALNYESFSNLTNGLTSLKIKSKELILRGQFLKNEKGLLYLGSPFFRTTSTIINNNLNYQNFAFHDPQFDLLHLLNNQENSTAELKELVELINTQKEKLNTDKKELERLSLVASANENGIIFTNNKGRIIWCNDAYSKVTGFSKEEVIGKTPIEIGLNETNKNQNFQALLEPFYKGQLIDIEFLHGRKDGSCFWVKSKGHPVLDKNGDVQQYFAMIEDITSEKEANSQLLESQSRLTTLIANLQIGLLLEDKDRNILFSNQKFCDLFQMQIKPQDLIGINCNNIAGLASQLFQNPDKFAADIDTFISDKKAVIGNQLELQNGKIYSQSYTPIFKESVFNGNLWTYDDVTTKIKYEESLALEKEKYSRIIANMNLGLIETNLDDEITLVNQSFIDISGFSSDELIGKKGTDLFLTPNDKEKIWEKLKLRTEKKSDSYEIAIINKEGERREWLVSGAPNTNINGEVIGSIGIHLDITERNKLEAQKEELLKKLEIQNEQLNDYAQIVSHDLKSPLRSIHSLITWIIEDDATLSELALNHLKLIEQKVESMDSLIEGILTYAKLDTISSTKENVDIANLVKTIVDIIYVPENIQIEIQENLPTIKADNFRMHQVFQNLISNAVNYNDKPIGFVKINCIEEADKYIFTVKDNGQGIAKEHQEKMFNSFQSFTKMKGSTGLGLSIVKKIIKMYDGKIIVESELGVGTTFFIHLKKQ